MAAIHHMATVFLSGHDLGNITLVHFFEIISPSTVVQQSSNLYKVKHILQTTYFVKQSFFNPMVFHNIYTVPGNTAAKNVRLTV